LRDLMAQFNVLPQSIKSGEFTDIGTSARALTEGEKALLQAMADEFHKQLIADVKRTRPAVTDATAFDGRIFTGTQAKTKGLVDHIGDLDEALQLAGQLGCPGLTARPGAVMYRRANDPARSVYAVTANIPLQGSGLFPSLPGLDRAKMPTFLSLWQPELSIEKLGGK
jgi:protease-4